LKMRPDPASAAVSPPAPVRRVKRRPDAERPVPLARPLPEQLARLVPAAVLVGVSWALAWTVIGSIAARDWLPYALLAAIVLAVALLSGRVLPNRAGGLALGGLLGLAALDALSLVWSPVPSLARDEALLAFFYVLVLAVALLTVREEADRSFAVAIVALGAASVTVATALKLRGSVHPDALFFGGRLDFPISYVNAQAALMLLGFWPAAAVAARREAPLAVRGAAVGGSTAVLCGWLLTQSKGGGLGLIASAAAVFAVSRQRLRIAVPALISAALAAIAIAPLTAPIRASNEAGLDGAIKHGATVLLLLTAVGIVAGVGYAVFDRRLELSRTVRELVGRIALVAVIAVSVGGAGAFLVGVNHPLGFLDDKWHAFRVNPAQQSEASHLLVLGSNRYDFWRVALGQFAGHPLLGIGARGFGSAYLQHRRSDESPARAHSLELDVLSETGLVGFGALVLAIGLPLVAAARRARSELAAAGAFGGAVYFLGHASVDWIWTFPAVGVLFFLLLGAGGSGGVRRSQRLSMSLAAPAAAAVLLLGLIAFAPPWLASRFNARSLKGGRGAMSDVRWARRLDPVSVDPWISASLLAPSAQAAFPPLEHAVSMEPRNYALHYLLGFAYLRADRAAAGHRELLKAYLLDPRDPLVASVLPEQVVPSQPARPRRSG
jgi:hypothetical protein